MKAWANLELTAIVVVFDDGDTFGLVLHELHIKSESSMDRY